MPSSDGNTDITLSGSYQSGKVIVSDGSSSFTFDPDAFYTFSTQIVDAQYDYMELDGKVKIVVEDLPSFSEGCRVFVNRVLASSVGNNMSDSYEDVIENSQHLNGELNHLIEQINAIWETVNNYDEFKDKYSKYQNYLTEKEKNFVDTSLSNETAEAEKAVDDATKNLDNTNNNGKLDNNGNGNTDKTNTTDTSVGGYTVSAITEEDPEKTDEEDKTNTDDKTDEETNTDEDKNNETFRQTVRDKLESVLNQLKGDEEEYTGAVVNVTDSDGDVTSVWVDFKDENAIKGVLDSISSSDIVWGSSVSIFASGAASGALYYGNISSKKDIIGGKVYDAVDYQETKIPGSKSEDEEAKHDEETDDNGNDEDKDKEDKDEESGNDASSPYVEIVDTTTPPEPTETWEPYSSYSNGPSTVQYSGGGGGGTSYTVPPISEATDTSFETATPTVDTPAEDVVPEFTFETMDPVVTNPDLEKAQAVANGMVSSDTEFATPSIDTEADTGAIPSTSSNTIHEVDLTSLSDINNKTATAGNIGEALVFGGAALATGSTAYNVYRTASKNKESNEEDNKEEKGE